MSDTLSALDANLVLRNVHDQTNDALNVNVVSGGTGLDKVELPSFVSYTDIDGSGGSYFEVIATTTNNIRQVLAFDTTGLYITLAVGGAGSEVVECIIGPGNDQIINVNIPAGSRISIRGTESTSFSAGSIAFNWLG